MLVNNIEVIENNLEDIKNDYKRFENYFIDVLHEWIEYYNLDYFKGKHSKIVPELIFKLDSKILDIRINHKKSSDRKEYFIEAIYFPEVIDEVLNEYIFDFRLKTEKECIEYLIEHDDTLEKSIAIAKKANYTINKINTTVLANLLYKENEYNKYLNVSREFLNMIETFLIHYIKNIYPRSVDR
jgi:hypothetical protein